VRRTGRGLSLLEDIFRAIAETDHPRTTLTRITQMVADRLDMEVCSVYSYTHSTKQLVLLATKGLDKGSVGLVSMGVDEGLTGYVIEKGEPVMAIDALSHPRYKYFPETGEERYHSFLGVPITVKGEPQGVLVVQTSRRRRFSRDEVGALKRIAVPIGGLLAQLRLLQSLETKEEERLAYQQQMNDAVKQLHEIERRHQGSERAQPAHRVRLTGLAAGPGFGIGRAHLFKPEVSFDDIPKRPRTSPRKEAERFHAAVKASVKEVERLKHRVQKSVAEFDASIFDAHRLMLTDATFTKKVEAQIKRGSSAEHALERVLEEMVATFSAMNEPYLRDRALDIKEIGQRILRNLLGVAERHRNLAGAVVLVAPDLAISDVMLVEREHLKAIVTTTGGATSHAAILAKSLEIPTVAGVERLEELIREGDHLIVDGNAGTVYVNPSPEVLREYERLRHEYRAFNRELDALRGQPAVTRDGHRITLAANIGLLGDLVLATRHGADAIGLYRTEMAFLTHREFLTEEEQVDLYTRVVRGMEGRPVTIRTLDLGADKYPAFLNVPHEANPFLGWRSTRISLDLVDQFKAQLRAVLRVSAMGPVRLMFPMISTLEEIRRVKDLVAEAGDELRLAGKAFDFNIPIGIMVEVPSAVQIADLLIREVDFFSIGTNDLVQYLLAVDRNNPRVASLYEPLHPSVLRAVDATVRAAREAGKSVSLCGEMAADPLCTLVLIGLGLRELSMSPFFIPVIKRLIRSVDMTEVEEMTREVLTFGTVKEVKGHVFAKLRELGLIDLLEMYH